MTSIYALIWRATEPDETWKQEEFDARIPRLMVWLKSLHAQGKLAGCGGGGFADRAGGLTLVRAESPEEAARLSSGSPMNEIGLTEIFLWDVYYADLAERTHESNLSSR